MSKNVKIFLWCMVLVLIFSGANLFYSRFSSQGKINAIGNNDIALKTEETSEVPSSTSDNTTLETQASDERGPKVPDFKLNDIEGNEVSLYDYMGKAVVLNFWASWCPPCKGEFPDFYELNKDFKERDDVALVTINLTDGVQETKEKAMKFLEDNGYTDMKVLLDEEGELAYMFAVESIPMTVVLDPEMRVSSYVVGMTKKDAVMEMLEKAIKEK